MNEAWAKNSTTPKSIRTLYQETLATVIPNLQLELIIHRIEWSNRMLFFFSPYSLWFRCIRFCCQYFSRWLLKWMVQHDILTTLWESSTRWGIFHCQRIGRKRTTCHLWGPHPCTLKNIGPMCSLFLTPSLSHSRFPLSNGCLPDDTFPMTHFTVTSTWQVTLWSMIFLSLQCVFILFFEQFSMPLMHTLILWARQGKLI